MSIYADYNLDSISDKHYFLVVFADMFRANLNEEDDTVCTLPKYTVQELRERVTESMHENREGKGQAIDDFLE